MQHASESDVEMSINAVAAGDSTSNERIRAHTYSTNEVVIA